MFDSKKNPITRAASGESRIYCISTIFHHCGVETAVCRTMLQYSGTKQSDNGVAHHKVLQACNTLVNEREEKEVHDTRRYAHAAALVAAYLSETPRERLLQAAEILVRKSSRLIQAVADDIDDDTDGTNVVFFVDFLCEAVVVVVVRVVAVADSCVKNDCRSAAARSGRRNDDDDLSIKIVVDGWSANLL
jgi:hypothetical protein